MNQEILLGDEAVALGAIHAGLSGGYSYPGTPASEIMEYLIRASDRGKAFTASWSVNEKVAFEEALGVSFAHFRGGTAALPGLAAVGGPLLWTGGGHSYSGLAGTGSVPEPMRYAASELAGRMGRTGGRRNQNQGIVLPGLSA